jgi:hypothetical protein
MFRLRHAGFTTAAAFVLTAVVACGSGPAGGGLSPDSPLPTDIPAGTKIVIADQGERQQVALAASGNLDSLPFEVKAVLQDPAVAGDPVSPGAVAATGQRDALEVAKALELLEQRDFLRRQGRNSETGEIEYGFRHLLVRDVVADQLPRAERAVKRERAQAWLEEPALDLTDRRAG